MNERIDSRWWLVGLALLMASSALTSWWVTRFGPSYSNTDSVIYVHAARTFIERGELLVPDRKGGEEKLHVWPPMYPFLLVATSKLSGSVLSATRWLNVVLFPLNLLLMAALGRRLRMSAPAIAFVCVVFALAPVVLRAHVAAMSESSCLFFWLLGMWLLMVYEQRQSWGLLVAGSLAMMAALLCRYMAIAPAAVGGLFILLYTRGGWAPKLGRAAVYALITLVPLLYWMHTRSSASGVEAIGRKFAFYGVAVSQAYAAGAAYVRWVAPFDGHSIIKQAYLALAGVLALAWVAFAVKSRGKSWSLTGWNWRNHAPMLLLLASLMACEGLIFVAAAFVDATEYVGERVHLYSLAMVLLLVGAWASSWFKGDASRANAPARYCLRSLAALLLAVYLIAGVFWLASARTQHLEFNTTKWRESKGLDLLQQRYADSPLYINYFAPIYFRTGRIDVHYVPIAFEPIHHTTSLDLDSEMAAMVKDLSAHHGVIFYFKDLDPKMLTVEQLKKDPALHVVDETDDAIFFRAVDGG